MPENNKKTYSDSEIRASLLAQLEAHGALVPHYQDLIEDYLFFRALVKKMKRDIKKRGMSYPAVSASGKEYEKDNPNIKLLATYNRQMMDILTKLDLTTDNADGGEDDEL